MAVQSDEIIASMSDEDKKLMMSFLDNSANTDELAKVARSQASAKEYTESELNQLKWKVPATECREALDCLTFVYLIGKGSGASADNLKTGLSALWSPCPVDTAVSVYDDLNDADIPFEREFVKYDIPGEVRNARSLVDAGNTPIRTALNPLIDVSQLGLIAKKEMVDATVWGILLTIPRLIKMDKDKVNSLTEQTPMIKSLINFMVGFNLQLYQALVIQAFETGIMNHFQLGREFVRQLVITWEYYIGVGKKNVSQLQEAFRFGVLGVKASGFIAWMLYDQAAARLHLSYSELMKAINLKSAFTFMKVLKQYEPKIVKPHPWFLYLRALCPGTQCPLSATNHLNISYLCFLVAGEKDDSGRPRVDKINTWAQKITEQNKRILEAIARKLELMAPLDDGMSKLFKESGSDDKRPPPSAPPAESVHFPQNEDDILEVQETVEVPPDYSM